MATRTITVLAKVRLTIIADDDVSISDVLNEMNYEFTDTTTQALIEDTEIYDFEIADSR